MDILKSFWCCTQGSSVVSFISSQPEVRLARSNRTIPRPFPARPSIAAYPPAMAVGRENPFLRNNCLRKPNRPSSCKPVQQRGDESNDLNDSSFSLPAKTARAKANTHRAAEFRLANLNSQDPDLKIFKESSIPYPKLAGVEVPERLDKNSFLKARGKSMERKSELTDSIQRSEVKYRKSLAAEQTPAQPLQSARRTSTTKGAVAPSTNSAFRYVPQYFKPDVLKKFKFDADLVTALAKATECRQKGGGNKITKSAKFSGIEITETATSMSTLAITSRTTTTKGEQGNIGQIHV